MKFGEGRFRQRLAACRNDARLIQLSQNVIAEYHGFSPLAFCGSISICTATIKCSSQKKIPLAGFRLHLKGNFLICALSSPDFDHGHGCPSARKQGCRTKQTVQLQGNRRSGTQRGNHRMMKSRRGHERIEDRRGQG